MYTSYVIHKGKKILYIDYRSCKTIPETLAVLEEVKAEFYKTTGDWLTLNDFRDAYGSKEYMMQANKYAKEIFNQRPARNAAIGVLGLKKVLLQAYNLIIRDKIVPFDTLEEALDYLAK